MRAIIRIVIVLLPGLLAGIPNAMAFTALGHGRLVGMAAVRADYDSNIFVSDSQVEDVIATLTGEVRYARDSSLVTFEAAAGANVLRFSEHDGQNSADPYIMGALGYTPSEKTELRGELSLRRNTLANESVNARTKSNDLALRGRFQHLPSDKLGFRLEGTYNRSDYLTSGYSDIENYSGSAQLVHVYSEKLKLLAGVTALEWRTDSSVPTRRGVSSRDWRYTMGAEGEFGPKITGEANVGLLHRGFTTAGFSNADTLYVSGRVSWTASGKTIWSVLAAQDLGLSAADQSVKSLNCGVSVLHRLSEKVSLEGNVGVDRSSYVGFAGVANRKDDGYTVRARLNYALREYASVDVSTGYRNNDSSNVVSDYDRFNFGVGATFRF